MLPEPRPCFRLRAHGRQHSAETARTCDTGTCASFRLRCRQHRPLALGPRGSPLRFTRAFPARLTLPFPLPFPGPTYGSLRAHSTAHFVPLRAPSAHFVTLRALRHCLLHRLTLRFSHGRQHRRCRLGPFARLRAFIHGRLPALFKVGLSLARRSQLPTGFPARPARRSWPAQAACTLASSGSSWSQCCWLRSPPSCSPSSLLRQSILTAFVNLFPAACSTGTTSSRAR